MQPTEDPNAQPMPETPAVPEVQTTELDPTRKKVWTEFKQRIEVCKSYRKKLVRNWSVNIDYRRGKVTNSQSDDDTISVNVDWSFTKTKQAALFSQVPKVRISHSPESVSAGPWVASFERVLNDTLVTAGIEGAMDEALPDCINAAGIGVVIVAREVLTEMKSVPSVDLKIFPPQIQMQALQTGQLFGQPIPMEDIPQPVDARYTITRVSPSDFLWPIDVSVSDFDRAPWLGRSGQLTWAEAKSRFNLDDADKDKVMSTDHTVEDQLSHDYERQHLADEGKVGFDEIFYNEYQFDPDSKSFSTIRHLVFLHSKPEPVVDEPWNGQQVDPETGTLTGCTKKPIRVLTLTYITDEDIPPSDSAIGRAQVNELNKSRNHINKQRARNVPWTWFDVNRLDPAIQQALMRGVWQHAIPVQGDGSRVIGSIPMPAIPQENYLFDKIVKADLQEQWTIGSNQLGSGEGVETKGESNTIQSNFSTKVARERARVASFFVGIAEVLGGLIALNEDPSKFGQGFDPTIAQKLAYSVLADSTVVVDSQQRLDRLNGFINTYAKSGWINLEPVLKEIAQLIGLDPTTTIVKPQPQQPEQPNISLRLTGATDMMNPLLLGFMMKAGLAPEAQVIEAAKALIQSAVVQQPPAPQPGVPQQPGAMQPPPPNVGEANPQASLLPAINKRSEDGTA